MVNTTDFYRVFLPGGFAGNIVSLLQLKEK